MLQILHRHASLYALNRLMFLTPYLLMQLVNNVYKLAQMDFLHNYQIKFASRIVIQTLQFYFFMKSILLVLVVALKIIMLILANKYVLMSAL